MSTTLASPLRRATALDPVLPQIVRATQAAAVACTPWVGRGDRRSADGAAVAAARAALADLPRRVEVVVGEGVKDKAPMLYAGEQLGAGEAPEFGLAIDPLENTNACARGAEGAISAVGVAPIGALHPTVGWYMDKLVVGPPAAADIDITQPPATNLRAVAGALGRAVDDLRVIVLDKPRHEGLVAELRQLGVAIRLIPDGDVFGALRVLLGEADLLLGVGGAPEGVLTACAVRALGGGMQARLAPQSEEERELLRAAGEDLDRVFTAADLVASEDCAFVATAVTDAGRLRGPRRDAEGWGCDSVVIVRGEVTYQTTCWQSTPRSR